MLHQRDVGDQACAPGQLLDAVEQERRDLLAGDALARGIRERVGAGVSVETTLGCEIRRKVPSMFDAITGVQRKAPLTEEQNSAEIEKAVS